MRAWQRNLLILLVIAAPSSVAVWLKVDEWAWNAGLGESWERFEANAEPWVAVGTIGLALATVLLALHTRSLAKQSREEVRAVAESTAVSREEVELSRRALQANARPMLVDAPLGVFISPKASGGGYEDRGRVTMAAYSASNEDEPIGVAQCIVPMQNVGSGAALIKRFDFTWFGGNWLRQAQQTVVPPRQLTRFEFSREDLDPGEAEEIGYALSDASEGERVEVEVEYTDMDGDQRTRTRLVISHLRGRSRVTQVMLYNGDDLEPFADLSKELTSVGRTMGQKT